MYLNEKGLTILLTLLLCIVNIQCRFLLQKAKLVWQCLPQDLQKRWKSGDGANMKAMLEAAGYTVDLRYASNNVATQISQIRKYDSGRY